MDILELGMWGWERFREVRSSGVSLGGGVANSTQLQYVSQSLARPTSNAATFWTIDEEMAIFQNEVVVTTRFLLSVTSSSCKDT